MHPPPSIPTPPPDRDTSPPSPPPARSKLQLFNNLRRRSGTSQPRPRPSSAYENWIENALSLAQSPTVEQEPHDFDITMARLRSGSAPDGNGARQQPTTQPPPPPPLPPPDQQNPTQQASKDEMPTIRLIPHHDHRSTRPSLTFPATTRTLPNDSSVIRVGRYSERDINPVTAPNTPSAAPIGFKSKVVSRRHCEFFCTQGQWHVKDVKSSSGTFLNHIRLSQPNIESRPFPVNDGDVIQLGIDFRGGEEMIFRCVKIRVECNRGWQKQLNNYNVSAHKRLRGLGKSAPDKDSDAVSTTSSQECSICLMSIAPCQSLFVAPCYHVWHYKCIRPILNDHKTYPQFMCPNCRAVNDLDAEVDDAVEPPARWEDEDDIPADQVEAGGLANGDTQLTHERTHVPSPGGDLPMINATSNTSNTAPHALTVEGNVAAPAPNNTQPLYSRRQHAPLENGEMRIPTSATQYLRPITPTEPLMVDEHTDGTNEAMLAREGPMTPTNTAGPFLCG